MTRAEAIAMIEDDKKRHHDELSGRYRAALTMAIEVLQHEPKTGKWEDKGDYYVCSECGERMPYSVFSGGSRAYAYMSEYCPRCGARMESDEE